LSSVWLTASTIAAAAPFVEFVAEQVFARIYGLVSGDLITEAMKEDDQDEIKALANNTDVVATLNNYGENREQIGDVLRASTLALLGVVISQYEVTNSLLCTTPFHLGLVVIIIGFMVFFLIQLIRKRIQPARVHAVAWYHGIALLLCIMVIVLGHIPEKYLASPSSATTGAVTPTPVQTP
jgi:hypothetical protein